jgi:hypothetical protein
VASGEASVNTFGIDREVDVRVGFESDTLHLLEYERMLNVFSLVHRQIASRLKWMDLGTSFRSANRAPVIFWQGLVRLTAVCSVLYAVPAGLSQPWEYALVVFDGAVGLTYVIGMARVTGCSPIELLQCKTTPAAQTA